MFLGQVDDIAELCQEVERDLNYWLIAQGESLTNSLCYHEETTRRSTSYEPFVVPVQLQTPAYARARMAAVSRCAEEAESTVGEQIRRRQVMHDRRGTGQFIFFVHERALRLQVGDTKAMHEQLMRLAIEAALDNVSLRVIPADASAELTFGGPFTLFEYHDHAPLAYLGNVASGLFVDDPAYVEPYRRIVSRLSGGALDAKESRLLVLGLADQLDRL